MFLVYNHPKNRQFENIFTKASLYQCSIIVGDFNLNNRAKKKQLTNFLKNSNCLRIETGLTFNMTNNEDSTVDIILCTNNLRQNIIKVEEIPDLGAEHLALKLSISMQQQIVEKEIIRYNFKKTDMDKVNSEILDYLDSVSEVMSEDLITRFNNKIKEVFVQNTPISRFNFYRHELIPFIISLIRRKRSMYREYRATEETIIKAEINRLNKNIQELIREYSTHKWIKTK